MTRSVELCCLAEFPQHIDDVTRWIIEEWPDPKATFAARRTRVLGPPDSPATLLATSDRYPVGVLGFGRFQQAGDDHQSLFIDVLYVHATARRLGIGTALLGTAVAVAQTFEDELFVYTAAPAWYRDRGCVVRQSGDDEGRFVLSRELSRTA
jgi:ribosomal protein S18 acetylase RimI-like enzyme